jgi:hypothetical protein
MERDSDGLPGKPACFPDSGKILCDCERTMKKFDCAARRTFWMHAKTIADLPDDLARREHMLGLAKAHRRELGRAARSLMA